MDYHFSTKCLYGTEPVEKKADRTGSLTMPIYQTATFAHPAVGRSTGYDYSRAQNPTREKLEQVAASLEEGYGAVAFSTGMAALTTVFDLFEAGSHIIATEDLYGGTVRFFATVGKKNGLEVTYCDTADLEAVKRSVKENTKAIFIETPSNPLMHVTDISTVSQWAKEQGLLVIVDNTFLSPYFQKPLRLGADIVVHSGTKFLGGHNDTLAGLVIAASRELDAKLRYLQMTTGAVLAPLDAWLILRGIKTLPIRMERAQENAFQVAEFLSRHPKVEKVFYVGSSQHPSYEISKKQTTGFGSMISFSVDCKETAVSVLEKVRVFHFAESLGGVESLITYPALQTHAEVPEEVREKLGINSRFLRMSVGIEDVRDLLSDLAQALDSNTLQPGHENCYAQEVLKKGGRDVEIQF